jgi:hypothetical protein
MSGAMSEIAVLATIPHVDALMRLLSSRRSLAYFLLKLEIACAATSTVINREGG